jgi:outer membrane protein assembly factor BamD (BamD/ComL family)
VSADSRDTGLATERTLIETARSALARRDGVAVLQAVDRHAALFPSGQLAEEREALAVQALVITGRADEARARADRFRQRFPNGLYRPIVDAALLTISR